MAEEKHTDEYEPLVPPPDEDEDEDSLLSDADLGERAREPEMEEEPEVDDDDRPGATRKMTTYQVMYSEEEHGPWIEIGEFTEATQLAAKRAGFAKLKGDVEAQVGVEQPYFLAVPLSSYAPQKPRVTVVFE